MRQILSALQNFRQIRGFGIEKLRMEDKIKDIFYAAVEAVKPSELITKNKLLSLKTIENKEIIVINHKGREERVDITDKNIHIGN
jgi:hypothetical protein